MEVGDLFARCLNGNEFALTGNRASLRLCFVPFVFDGCRYCWGGIIPAAEGYSLGLRI